MFADPIAVQRFAQLRDKFGFTLMVETGTGHGKGSITASQFCPVFTMELNPDVRDEALRRWKQVGFPGHPIVSVLGNSPDVIAELRFTGRCCFYLDAHGNDYWPILDELKAIASLNKPDSLIIIHDFKVPNQPWGFDTYKGQPLDLDYVRPGLLQINPNYRIWFPEQVSGSGQGICYATIP